MRYPNDVQRAVEGHAVMIEVIWALAEAYGKAGDEEFLGGMHQKIARVAFAQVHAPSDLALAQAALEEWLEKFE